MAHDSAREPETHPEASTETTSDDGRKSLLNRRQYLKMGAAAAATVAVGTATASAATEHRGISFDRVVNAVEDLGMDPNGNEPIDDALYGAMEDGTLIEFPAGEYVFRDYSIQQGVSRFGIRGLGDDKSDVQFRTADGSSRWFLYLKGGSDILLENVTLQQGMDKGAGDIGLGFVIEDNLQIHDVEMAGFNTSGDTDRWGLMPKLTDPDGEGLVTGFVQKGPSDHQPHAVNDGAGGVFSGHMGTLVFRDCHIENAAGDGGLYTGKHKGSTNFENCFFKNNDMAVMRMGAGSYIRDSTIVADFDNWHPENTGDPGGVNGLYFASGQHGKSGGGVYNCDVIVKSVPEPGQGAIAINSSDGNLTIKNTRVRCDVDGMAPIRALAPGERFSNRGHKTPEKPWGITIENVSVTGSANTRDGAINLDTRPGSVVKDACVYMTGNSDGVTMSNSGGSEVVNTNIKVPGKATVFNGSQVATNNITSRDSCPAPNADWRKSGGDEEQPSTEPSGPEPEDADAAEDALPNRIAISGPGPDVDAPTTYQLTVDGALEAGDDLEDDDGISGSSAEGTVAGGTDTYRFDGEVTAFEFDGDPPVVEVDGENVPPASLGEAKRGTNILTVRGTGDYAEYEFAVSGSLEANDGDGTVDDEDNVTKQVAAGAVTGGVDSYRFTGGLVSFVLDGDAEVVHNGEVVSPEDLLPENVVEFVGGEGVTSYGVTVDGVIAPDPEGTLDSEDNISGGSAEGAVSDGVDAYRFDGDITSVTLDGDATVRVNGTEVAPEQFGDDSLPNLIVVEGDGEESSYRFEVDGEVEKYADIGTVSAEDRIDGGTVTGSVSGGVDAYRFDGDLTAFDVDGTATVGFDERDD
ncbi:hypothetical protein [Halomarina ordinaria]|uniref:Right-handed parallel beta-helix repeat-containing protein n=1 Tax=Halomarina ordinaria TaxID=3033939 RepID=A0ABD5UHU0_9EURY|nr:hypothetical protein [Halomarina sp. PSRA2]